MDEGLRNIWITALKYCKDYEDSNPDVGMGPFLDTLLTRVEERAGVQLTVGQRSIVLNGYKEQYGDR